MSEPKVCFLFPHLALGGGETAMMEVAEGLRDNFDVSVCVLERRKSTAAVTIDRDLHGRFSKFKIVRSREELKDVLRQIDLLVWYGTNNWTPNALQDLARRPGSIRVVHTDKKEEGIEFYTRWRGCIDAVSCVSPVVQRSIPGAVTIPNTASLRYLKGRERAFFPSVTGYQRKTIGFLGRLLSFKNVDWLIENINRLECNLLIQGLDTDEFTQGDLQRLCRRLGVADRVHFLEPSRDVGTLLRSIDVLAIVSRHEGFPMVAVEAGMVGTPVIATRVGALPEYFPDEMLFIDLEQGFPSIDGFRSALNKVNAQWGEKLKDKVARLCSKDSVVVRYGELIQSVLARGTPRDRAPEAS